MTRCAPPPGRRLALAAVATLLVGNLPSPAQAQLARPFPANALRGKLEVTQPPEVLLNGQPTRLTPGSRIRGANNLLVLSGAIQGQELLVHYTLDGNGQVHNVWILTPDEAARKPWPSTLGQLQTWLFDANSQTWTRR